MGAKPSSNPPKKEKMTPSSAVSKGVKSEAFFQLVFPFTLVVKKGKKGARERATRVVSRRP
ncbi:hypothetical protein AKJ49_02380 [candidate division MSBL1 archaeon SCGC-AAA382A03]|uniref:Uncharacterized protein n=1 Tax=candidate division MSBL1 archaeon SCGC-AAA382A03 TaxID=1698278 RepID=A0A133VC68_9EURY|nr:hypothetical protein AKJ49_02380 [candidate division MSBL1 archaeon SCGC-AAA382A03]